MRDTRSDLIGALEAHRNADGGWGYYAHKASRIEPTCWALLSLSRAARRAIDLDVLSRWPRERGWLIDVSGVPVNYASNALAALTAATHADGQSEARRIAQALLDVRGITFEPSPAIRQDNSLDAWPWIAGTFSWAEPTSLCLLVLKKLRRELPEAETSARIAVGERVLLDRACAAGGWNYGGSNAFGHDLFPYVPTTALGLLAMHDRASEPAVARALSWLVREAPGEASAQSAALAVIALGVYGTPMPALERALDSRAAAATAAGDQASVLALATGLYALTRASDGDGAFTI